MKQEQIIPPVADAPILVVDDKPENLHSFQMILSREGFEVVTVDSGMKALKYLMNNPVALVLLDVQMPEISGFETAQMIRQREDFEELPIIFISATQNTDELINQGYAVGAFDYLTKPIDPRILVNKVKLFHRLYIQQKTLEERNRAITALNCALENNETLKEAVESAERAGRAKDEFLASMSHELRTPLTTVIGNGELMGDTSLTSYQNELLDSMTISGKSLLYLINDILDTSKIEAGKFEIDHTKFDLCVLLRELRHIFQKRAEKAGLQFQIEEQINTHIHCIGDGKRLTQVLVNLLGNAIKFTQQGAVKLTIAKDHNDKHPGIRFIVEDTGIGIEQKTVDRLFKPFEQADQSISGRFGGTGLGLYISSNLVTLMEGELFVESEPGKGSKFYLTLPLEQVEEEGAESAKSLTTNTQPEAPQLSGRVLIADDAPELQLLIRRMVEVTGVEVIIVSNGQEALDSALASPYELILMDMQMPVMDGIEATRRIRDSGNQGAIVALTANVMEQHRKQFEKAGCNGFLTKPIDRALLYDVLSEHCTVIG
ncbi:MAG: response regulator [Gammaproteobacteria bacterium]|jgi:signal transduction histidine kinase|nr:response regulator [Gammaproteobacteria bacterium]MBT4606944.1 response regulator [Thiotrichales bacterium]MBT3968133.1 response regulator [Gammaproteobacteria bacterium]MBT4079524.1 response regulator [Gammaproteobacteria bacterium]MBT4330842.1 response regulator [Gammaproteobacteria bacterium]